MKQLGPAQPKKRLDRGALSISAPLGDFRHTLHVGRGGDAFGDTSFLSRHGGGPPPEPGAPPVVAPHSVAPPAAPQPPVAVPSPADPLLSFHLDLGPSMLDAVLGVMDAERSETTATKRRLWCRLLAQDLPRGAAPGRGVTRPGERRGPQSQK